MGSSRRATTNRRPTRHAAPRTVPNGPGVARAPRPDSPFMIEASDDGVLLTVHVIPRAAKSAIAGVRDGAILVRLQAPPVDGAANDALVALLAERLGVARRQVELIAGATSRRKRVRVRGVEAVVAAGRLERSDG